MAGGSSSLVFLEYLTTVFDNIKDAVLLVSIEPHGKYKLLLANAGFERSSGHHKSEIGAYIDEIVTPTSYDTLKKLYKKVVDTKKTVTQTGWYEVPIGRRAYENTMIPIFSAVGEVIQIAVITRDVTELLNLRQELRDTASQLEKTAKQLRKSAK